MEQSLYREHEQEFRAKLKKVLEGDNSPGEAFSYFLFMEVSIAARLYPLLPVKEKTVIVRIWNEYRETSKLPADLEQQIAEQPSQRDQLIDRINLFQKFRVVY
ncbi:MAG TPA: hypothetical protein PKD79_02415 [Candidatus Doudnabacteria bacterium]|nr:hypothetical protein [Candidatus Doudnabacteria bacterium]